MKQIAFNIIEETILVTTGEATNKFDHIKDPIVFSTRINQMIDNLKPSDS